jgi:hypothetical protein
MLAPVPTAQCLTQSLFWRGWKVSSAVLFDEPAAGRAVSGWLIRRPCRDRLSARRRQIAEEADRRAQAEAAAGEGDGKKLELTARLLDQVAERFPATRAVTSFCVWRIDFSSG